MASDQSGTDVMNLALNMQLEADSAQLILDHFTCPHMIGFTEPICEHRRVCVFSHPQHIGIITVENCEARRGERGDHLCLLRSGHLQCAERGMVFTADGRHDGDVRSDQARVTLHLSLAVDSDLDDGVVSARFDVQNGGCQCDP